MLAASVVLILLCVLMGITGFAFLLWGLLTGQFDNLTAQSMTPLDEEDLRLFRPWETTHERNERARVHGALLQPRDSDWGGRF